jgi:hypothetical protein
MRGIAMLPRLRRASAALLAASLLTGSIASTVSAVDPIPSFTTLTWFANGPLQENHPITLLASIGTESDAWDDGTTVDFDEVDGLGGECHGVAVNPDNQMFCVIDNLEPGTYHYVATYSGNAEVAGSESDVLEITIVADTVDASGVKVNPLTFYPVKDGYRDALTISGHRLEAIAVTISIYNANNKRVKLVMKSSASGGYSYAWNGRSSKGDVLPAGKYRIVQKLVDEFGTTKSFTSYANLSTKKLVTLTKTITRNGSAIAAQLGNVALSGGTLRVKARSGGASGAGWQFKIPSAVSYKSLQFRVSSAVHFSAPPTEIAMQNFNRCTVWDTGCFDRWKGIGNTSGGRRWYSTSGSPTSHRKGTVVRGIIYVPNGTVYVYKAEVKVKYQVLR